MKDLKSMTPGYYWCTHELAMWIPDGQEFPREWNVVYVADGCVAHAGADQQTPADELPEYVSFYGPLVGARHAWQPIATAPKDGTRVLVHEMGERIPCVAFFNGAGWMADETHYFGDYGLHDDISMLDTHSVTHWVPLPDLPVELGG